MSEEGWGFPSERGLLIGGSIAKKGYIPLELLGHHAQRIFWKIVEEKRGKEFARKAKQEHERLLNRKEK